MKLKQTAKLQTFLKFLQGSSTQLIVFQ